MKKLFGNKKKSNLILGLFIAIIFAQALIIGKLFSERNYNTYEVNLVKINTEKDSIDYLKLKNDLINVDRTVQGLNSFLKAKGIENGPVMALEQDSISGGVYLAKQSNRYSQYLVDLQKKLQTVPLGIPTDGYISSNFGIRKNPIPPKNIAMAAVPAASEKKTAVKVIEEKDSLGNVIKRTVVPEPKTETQPQANNPPAEADQMQFHKGLDVAVAYGSDVRAAATGTVIFAGEKGGYGNCVIISHGNGLATLYGHLSKILVAANDQVKVNDVIAKSGNSGRSTGPHLHYEVHRNNTPVNPKLFLNF